MNLFIQIINNTRHSLHYDSVQPFLYSMIKLPDVTKTQTLSYLKATGLTRGLLINFSEKKLINGVRRISL